MDNKYEVGQTVIITDVNAKGTVEATVTKVGRTLVYVDGDHYRRENSAYRIDTGVRNDAYQHSRIWLPEEWAEHQERGAMTTVLREWGIVLERGNKLSIEQIRQIAKVVFE